MPIWRSRPRWGAEEARAALADLDASGLSIAMFAKREGLVAERLYNWRRKLAGSGAPAAPAVDFVEISARACGSGGRVEVVLPSGVMLRVAETIEPAALVRLVTALAGGC